MTVQEIMTKDVGSCDPNTDLGQAAKIMWDADCGIVPVVDGERHVVGVVTDRDICIALATRPTTAGDIRVREVLTGNVQTCSKDDDVRNVLSVLKSRRVRRLPVVDRQNRLVGILSINDLVACTDARGRASVPADEFLDAMRAICAHTTTAVPV